MRFYVQVFEPDAWWTVLRTDDVVEAAQRFLRIALEDCLDPLRVRVIDYGSPFGSRRLVVLLR